MMKKVVWSSKAQKNYRDNLLYLKEFWTKKKLKDLFFWLIKQFILFLKTHTSDQFTKKITVIGNISLQNRYIFITD